MGGQSHAELREAVTAHVRRSLRGPDQQARLLARLARLFPTADAPADLSPPLLTWRIALALELPHDRALALGVSACCFYAAADLADDLADAPEAPPAPALGLDVNDVCTLLFLQQSALLALPGPAVAELARAFAGAGLAMAEGQAADLSSTDALVAGEPLDIAAGKGGAELALLVSAPARLAGLQAGPWHDFGQALGTLLQVQSDYLDLFLKPHSDDWAAGKATLPIRTLLADPVRGEAAALLLAGARGAVGRQQAARWLLIEAGTAGRFRAAAEPLLGAMAEAVRRAGGPVVLEHLRREVADLSQAIDDALETLVGADAPPLLVSAASETSACREAALAFLRADPGADETVERHRWGLFGRPLVEAGLFGRLVVAEALRAAGLPAPMLDAALSLADADGWRYFPGCREIPPDADDTGLALQALASRGRLDHPAARRGLESLRLNRREDGTLPTWLSVGAEPPEGQAPRQWMGEVCPGAMANAVLGWHRAAGADARPAADALARLLSGPETPESAFYSPVLVDALGLLALAEIGQGEQALVREQAAARLRARFRLSGRCGTVLETAFAATALAAVRGLPSPAVVRRALVDAQLADGGYPADPFYVTVGPHFETAHYGSRLVTTAAVVRALHALDEP